MKKFWLSVTSGFLVLTMFTGCSNKEVVEQGEVGKILTQHGFEPEILTPGAYKVCSITDIYFLRCYNKLIKLETVEQTITEDPITVRMKDNLNLVVEYLRVRIKPKTDPKILNAMFNNIKAYNGIITVQDLYNTYGKLIITRDVREVLSKYTIDEVRKNYTRITKEIYNKINKDFKHLPIMLLDLSIGKLKFPPIYNKAIELAKEKEIAIKKAQAEATIKLEKMKAQVKLAKGRYQIKMLEAKRIADYNKMIGKSVTPQLIELRKLEVQEELVKNLNGNKNVVYMPLPMMEKSNYFLNLKNNLNNNQNNKK